MDELPDFLRKHPLRRAIEEMNAAHTALRSMTGIHHTFEEYEALWREVLRRLERAWSKTQAAVYMRPGWKKIESEVAHLRKADPLLRYVLHARNADEHSIQDLTKDYAWNLSAVPHAGGIRITWSPWDRPLLPVTNRGVVYEPPRVHLGKSIKGLLQNGIAEPRVVAQLAFDFYADVLNRVSKDVVGNDYPK